MKRKSKIKSNKKYMLFLIIFLLLMILVLMYFMNRYNNIDIKNKSNTLLKDLYDMDTGKYHLKHGVLYTDNDYIISNKLYIFGDGEIVIDNYHNVKFLIDYNNKCISKTFLGNIKIDNNKCGKFDVIDIEMNRNNSKISFISSVKNL